MQHRSLSDAFSAGATRVAVLQQQIGDHNVAATMMVVPIAGPHWSITQLAGVVRLAYPSAEVSTVALGSGLPALRVREQTRQTITVGETVRTVPQEVVRFALPSPVSGYTLVEFATPVVGLAEAFGTLFDAIAATVRWDT